MSDMNPIPEVRREEIRPRVVIAVKIDPDAPRVPATGVDELIAWLRDRLNEREVLLLHSHAIGAESPVPIRTLLAEVAAKRRILDEIVDEVNGLDFSVDQDRRVGIRDEATEPYVGDQLVRLLAQPYAGRPGWREEWQVSEGD
jgi:hypothetical protein